MAIARASLPATTELADRWAAVLEEAGFRPKIVELADQFPRARSLEVPFREIDAIDAELADLVLLRPTELLAAGGQALRSLLPASTPHAAELRLRITELPPTARRAIRALRESDLNHLVAIDGIVRRVSEVRPQILEATFQCVACNFTFQEPQETTAMTFREPIECPEAIGGCGRTQGRTRFKLLPEASRYVDSQRIEIQENPEALRGGAHPQGIPVLLLEDLVGSVLPGDRLVANGILKSQQRSSASRGGPVRTTTFDVVLLGHSLQLKDKQYDEIEITEEEERLFEEFRRDPTIVDRITLSLAPTIKGMEEEKEAIALQLFGGVEKRHVDGVRVRGDINILLIGDPGVAKSQLLRYVAEVAPRGIYTSGKGATAAGLTAAAVKDDFAGGRWVLEAGMLVLADGGMAVIDELDKMTPEDRSAMHEALEQQTVSIAKAGITATLNARCPVLAAANPKYGRFQDNRSIQEQIDLPATLLSRFDVIYSIRDRPEESRDRFLASRILRSHREGEELAQRTVPVARGSTPPSAGAPLEPELLKKYIAYARKTVRPVLSEEALKALEEYYVKVRKTGEEKSAPVPITARQLEALVRLSEAAARARLSPVVALVDAQRAIKTVESFLRRVVATESGQLDIDVVATGISHSQRQRLDLVVETAEELQSRPEQSFTEQELYRAVERKGVSEADAKSMFHALRRQGELVEVNPAKGLWQLVRF